MEKVLAFRFISDRLPVLDVQYGQITDGHFKPFEDMYWRLHADLRTVAIYCKNTDILGTQILLKTTDFRRVLRNLYSSDHEFNFVSGVDIFPSFIVFHLKFDDHEQKEENTEAR